MHLDVIRDPAAPQNKKIQKYERRTSKGRKKKTTARICVTVIAPKTLVESGSGSWPSLEAACKRRARTRRVALELHDGPCVAFDNIFLCSAHILSLKRLPSICFSSSIRLVKK